MQLHGCHIKTQRPVLRTTRNARATIPWQTTTAGGIQHWAARPAIDLWRDREHLLRVHFGQDGGDGHTSSREAVMRAVEASDGAARFEPLCTARCHHDADEVLALAAPALQADREIVLLAVRRCGRALRYASLRLRDDRKVVLAAVMQDPRALQYASDRIRSDRAIAIQAVQLSGHALQHVAAHLQSDFGVVVAALAADIPLFEVEPHPSVRRGGIDYCAQLPGPEPEKEVVADEEARLHNRRSRQRQKAEHKAATIAATASELDGAGSTVCSTATECVALSRWCSPAQCRRARHCVYRDGYDLTRRAKNGAVLQYSGRSFCRLRHERVMVYRAAIWLGLGPLVCAKQRLAFARVLRWACDVTRRVSLPPNRMPQPEAEMETETESDTDANAETPTAQTLAAAISVVSEPVEVYLASHGCAGLWAAMIAAQTIEQACAAATPNNGAWWARSDAEGGAETWRRAFDILRRAVAE